MIIKISSSPSSDREKIIKANDVKLLVEVKRVESSRRSALPLGLKLLCLILLLYFLVVWLKYAHHHIIRSQDEVVILDENYDTTFVDYANSEEDSGSESNETLGKDTLTIEVIEDTVIASGFDSEDYSKWLINQMKSLKYFEQCSNVPNVLKFDCHPEDGANEEVCLKRGCCWTQLDDSSTPLNVPYCYYSNNWKLYEYETFGQDGNDFAGTLKLSGQSPYARDLKEVKVEASGMNDNIIRVKMYDSNNERYEPPWPIRNDPKPFTKSLRNVNYEFHADESQPGFQIKRSSDKEILFDSLGIGGFIFSDQFLQLSAILPSNLIYGLGEHRSNLRLSTDWQSFTFFNADQPPVAKSNLYGSHPFYLVIEDSGNCHGVLFLNSNAMDIILQPAPAVTFRSIGGVFDIYFMMGPTPADVIRQYSEIVGKPIMPPYWSLGFHLSRFGLRTLDDTIELFNRTRAAEIPYDTQWNDLDYMDNSNDFTYNKKSYQDLPKFIEKLHSLGMHYVPLIDAGVSGQSLNGTYLPFNEGLRQNIFIKDGSTNEPFLGKVWNPVSTVWPDFTHPNVTSYYTNMMQNLHDQIQFDGAWIDMNEPSNFYNGKQNGCEKNPLDYPEFIPNVHGNLLSYKTVCMNAKHHLGRHYDLHNTFGISQAVATNYALIKVREKRPFIISRSTWVGHGRYAGHWTGDIYSTWDDMKMSIADVLQFSFFQVPMVGSDICGFNGNTTKSLCNRWMQLGAFYPFSRNHNSDDTIEQDPVFMGDLVVASSKKALKIRYWLLPYLYTLFYRANQFGDTVARPLFVEFNHCKETYDIDTQFMWGSSLMIVPVVEEGKTQVTAFVPRGVWYDLYSKEREYSIGKNYTLKAPLDTIPLLIRGGSILPAQQPSLTTTQSRKNPFELLVALDEFQQAKGQLYWDDGDSLETIENNQFVLLNFTAKNNTLTSTKVGGGDIDETMILGGIEIYGIDHKVVQVFLNQLPVEFDYDSLKVIVRVIKWDLRKPFTVTWQTLS